MAGFWIFRPQKGFLAYMKTEKMYESLSSRKGFIVSEQSLVVTLTRKKKNHQDKQKK